MSSGVYGCQKPLKRRMKIQRKGGVGFSVNFKYERVPTFYFICGVMGHAEKFCPRLYDTPTHLLEKPFGVWMRANQKKTMNLVGSKWLRSGDGSERGRTDI